MDGRNPYGRVLVGTDGSVTAGRAVQRRRPWRGVSAPG
jgi:nucleotide-binding universal stress UspA family protein